MTEDNELLLSLMNMGFDYFLCKKAISNGSKTLEEASNWQAKIFTHLLTVKFRILNQIAPANVNYEEPSSPKLSLKKLPSDLVASTSSSSDQFSISQQNTEKRISTSVEDASLKVKSRYKESRKDFQDIYIEKELEKVKKLKNSEFERKKEILRQIKDDRNKLKKVSGDRIIGRIEEKNPEKNSVKATISPSNDDTTMQFRLPTGSLIRKKFLVSSTLEYVFNFVETNLSSEEVLRGFELLVSFPRKVFTRDHEGATTISDAGLRNATLSILLKTPVPEIIAGGEEIQNEVVIEDENSEHDMDEDSNDNSDDDLNIFGDPWANLGDGHGLGTQSSSEMNLEPTTAGELEFASSNFDALQQRRERMAAARTRFINQHDDLEDQTALKIPVEKKHQILSLKDLSLKIASRTVLECANDHDKKLSVLKNFSNDLGLTLIQYLIKNKKFDRACVEKLSNCTINHLILDDYSLTTDSLLSKISLVFWKSLSSLSLQNCEFLTDKGFLSLTGCKHLEELNVQNCRLTDVIFETIIKLTNLKFLNLSKTKITSNFLNKFKKISSRNENSIYFNLIELNLSSCTNLVIDNLKIFTMFCNLERLNLSRILFNLQGNFENINDENDKLLSLEYLNLSFTELKNDDVSAYVVKYFPNIAELDILECPLIDFEGIKLATERLVKLNCIIFPKKNDLNINLHLKNLTNLPIETLDLNYFVNLTDEGILGLSSNKDSLIYLSLLGTNITDLSFPTIAGFYNLEELYFDRLPITDKAISELTSTLGILKVLSLSDTLISDASIIKIGKSKFRRSLSKLNLINTNISNKSVIALKDLINLSTLILDGTFVTEEYVLDTLKYLNHLTPPRFRNLRIMEEDEG